mmetsp:Transcript_7279/g.14278  ORF Transcript_7279/g.14278 Transcript_7279/m.14278 type:complete len:237 (+) Transcript_7279:1352-2062(+)
MQIGKLSGDVRQRQIGHYPLVVVETEEGGAGSCRPRDVVVGQHYSLWLAGRTRGVDQRATVAWFLLRNALLQQGVALRFSEPHELRPADQTRHICFGSATPLNNGLQVWETIPARKELLHLHIVLDKRDLGLAVVGNVMRGLDAVGSVNTRGDSASEDSPDIREEPFRAVEPHDHGGAKTSEAKLEQRLSNPAAIIEILLIGPRHPLALALHGHSLLTAVLAYALFELFDDSDRGV